MALAPDAPRLEDWITLPESAEILGVSKQAVHKIVGNNDLKTLKKIGHRPVYIVSEAEVRDLHARRQAEAQARAQARAQAPEGRSAAPA